MVMLFKYLYSGLAGHQRQTYFAENSEDSTQLRVWYLSKSTYNGRVVFRMGFLPQHNLQEV